MNKEDVLDELQSLINEGDVVLATKYISNGWEFVNRATYVAWKNKILTFLGFFPVGVESSIQTIRKLNNNMVSDVEICMSTLANIKEYVEKEIITVGADLETDVDTELDRIFSRFHKIARQLRSRHGGRETLKIEDEYDVQDLLHSLLHLYFEDIRDEEWTPSYAGSSARVDFLLKNEKVVIEVKKTRAGLEDKEIGNQLIEDIQRYQVHPDCRRLICFVYDPEGRIGNVTGLVNDLNSRHEGFARVVIKPDM